MRFAIRLTTIHRNPGFQTDADCSYIVPREGLMQVEADLAQIPQLPGEPRHPNMTFGQMRLRGGIAVSSGGVRLTAEESMAMSNLIEKIEWRLEQEYRP